MSSCYALLRESVNRRNAGKRIPVLAGGQVPRPEGENPQRQRPGERKGHAEAKAGTGEGHAEAKAGERKGRNR